MTQTNTADAFGRLSSTSNILGIFSDTYSGIGGQLLQVTHTGANAGFHILSDRQIDDLHLELARTPGKHHV